MLVETKFFDEVEINDEDIIYFEDGLLGFEDLKRYVLLSIDENGSLKCLQSVDRNEIAFIMVNPWDVMNNYKIDIDDNELMAFKDNDISNLLIYSISTITKSVMTANLIAPVIINTKTRQGKQVIMHNSNYTTKHIVKRFAESE